MTAKLTSRDFQQRRREATKNGATAVYAYLRVGTNIPYYVGVSTGPGRVIDQKGHRKHGISVPKDRTKIVFLRGPLSKFQAAAWESFYIAKYGRKDIGTGVLYNSSAGGEGLQEPSAETRRKISEGAKGRKPPQAAIAFITAYGKLPKSPDHKLRIKLAQQGRKLKPDHAANVAAAKAREVAQRAELMGLSLPQYQLLLKDQAREKERIRKQGVRAKAAELGMSKRTYEAWLADGCPDDKTPYLKPVRPPVPGAESLVDQAKRKAERIYVGLSERQYRLWVKDGRPSNVDHYRTIYGKPGRRPKNASPDLLAA